METQADVVDRQDGRKVCVHGIHDVAPLQAACDIGLIRDDHEREASRPQALQCTAHAGHDLQVAQLPRRVGSAVPD